ncbi:TPA: site-specific DNA-methyltransferase [Klebsiella oxytoca]|uniref:DNA-methyltransferase n=1 Tax=Citrobacter portucalensis TaxID=1639133 RepID=UPI000C22046E|nr:site-specific DNA-methyltransferase [Citrobacter portucalensis]ATX90540.1 site-specific DNA-methyltransferase [Citrobacter freundii]AVD76915.1 site-specific DNA-methyltransferase [Citrobacter freundii]HEJ8502778.1 site-specific DNA-methyltransferase [Klebsiella oxytoca]HEJ8506602.1 site-specific DNA-methyltransferase [Klebsiella oxytoca]
MKTLKPNDIFFGNTPDLIKELEPNSIALSVWSPPYYVGKEYEKYLTFQGWKDLLKDTIQGHFNALKPGGFMAINIDDILAFPDENMPRIQAPNKSKLRCKITREDILKAKDENPSFSRYQLATLLGCSEQTIDRRLNGNNIRGGKYSVQTRVHLVGHLLEKFAYNSGLYLYDRRIWVKDPAWQNSQWHSNSYRAVSEFEYIYIFWKPGETIIDRNRLKSEEWSKWGSRGVWSFPSVRNNRDHEAKFPIELPRRLIRLLTDENDIVLDPFLGSGTTAVACIQENRSYIGFDNQEKYIKLANDNISAEKMKLKFDFS